MSASNCCFLTFIQASQEAGKVVCYSHLFKHCIGLGSQFSLVVHAQPCPTCCNPLECSPPGSSVHGISQARMLEGVAISSSRGSSRHRDQTRVSCVSSIGRRILYCWATGEVPHRWKFQFCHLCLKRKRIDTWPTGGQETETILTELGLRPQCFRSHRLWPLIEDKFPPTLR